jgi:hypothetical protein
MRTLTAGWPVNALGLDDDGPTNTGGLSSSWLNGLKLMDPNGRLGLPPSERPSKTLKDGGFSESQLIRIVDLWAVSATVVGAL